MKYLGSTKGIRGKFAKVDCGSWERRLNAMTNNIKYHITRAHWDATHLKDFVWIARYNADLRAYEQLRRKL